MKILYQFGTTRCFFHQYLSHQVTDIDNFWIGDLIDDILRMAMRNDDAAITQHAEVPGDCRLRASSDVGNLAHPLRSIPENVDDFDA